MELKDTINLMTSDNYKDRFIAEYQQLKIRTEKLTKFVDNYDSLDFKPTCPKSLLKNQLKLMRMYLEDLEIRAVLEQIELNN